MNDKTQQGDQGNETGRMTKEDRFFGVSSPVTFPDPDDKSEPPEVEVADEDEGAAPPQEEPGKKPKAEAGKGEGADDEELETYSERVQKRINRLTWEAKEAGRQRDALQAERDEAMRVTQTLFGQNQQYQQIIQSGEGQLVARIKQAAEASVASATAAYRQAYEAGDTDEVIKTQSELIQKQAELQQALFYEQDYQQREAQRQSFALGGRVPQGMPGQQFAGYTQPVQLPTSQKQQVPEPSEEVKAWAAENPWFGTGPESRRDMTAVAYAKHESLIRDEGVPVNSPEYYEAIDAEMRLRFPDYFGKAQGGAPSSTSQGTTTVVAPATRDNSGPKRRKVRLNPGQVAVARQLGLTNEQYATQLLKDEGLL